MSSRHGSRLTKVLAASQPYFTSENISTNKKYIFKVSLSENNKKHWDEWKDICIQEMSDYTVNKELYPDLNKRTRFLNLYYDYLYRSMHLNGHGSLVRYMVSNPSEPEKTRTIGGFNVVFSWNNEEKVDERIKELDPVAWEQYDSRNKWLQETIFDRMLRIASSLKTSAWYCSSMIVSKEYRLSLDGIGSAGIAVEAMMKEKNVGENTPIVYGVTNDTITASVFMKKGGKFIQVYDWKAEEKKSCNGKTEPVHPVYLIAFYIKDLETLQRVGEMAYDEKYSCDLKSISYFASKL